MLAQATENLQEPAITAMCRTKQINEQFSSCLAEGNRYGCVYAFLFGDGYLCTHPQHREFR
ncbi:hypothetical protein GMSM_16500 [Geomonas sp. Red276]|uniref:hypothetical protein n=1 Tax=Geomonas sp. Red32 TaxID=2912856 RepID=UPI00202CB615|nr:hypothetical protein [Geomonas sp. Red32]MCM0081694.1 hypothetical protein [Geomonas sp. Red32]